MRNDVLDFSAMRPGPYVDGVMSYIDDRGELWLPCGHRPGECACGADRPGPPPSLASAIRSARAARATTTASTPEEIADRRRERVAAELRARIAPADRGPSPATLRRAAALKTTEHPPPPPSLRASILRHRGAA